MSNVTREKQKAMKALETLVNGMRGMSSAQVAATNDLRAFIEAAPEKGGEAVAWLIERPLGGYGPRKSAIYRGQYQNNPDSLEFYLDEEAQRMHTVTPLYAHPAAAKEPGVTIADPVQAEAHKAEVYEQMAARIAELEKDAEEVFATGQRMAQLLTGVANALRGAPDPLSAHSWHDLPERAAAAIAAIDVMQKAAAALAQPRQDDRIVDLQRRADFEREGG